MAGPRSDVIPGTGRNQVSRPRPPVMVPAVLTAQGVALAVLLALDGVIRFLNAALRPS